MVPNNVSGKLISITAGEFTVEEMVYEIEQADGSILKEHCCKMACS